jgi:hypothetical protein
MLAATVLAMAVAGSALAQQRRPLRPPPAPRPPAGLKQPTPAERRMLNMPPAWAGRLQGMAPEQQEKFLNNDARFRSLPPQQQAQIRQRLQAFNRLTPQQQQEVIRNDKVWQQMTPAQQRYVRQTLLPAWRDLPPARRQAVLGKLRDLRDLSDSERAAKLNDETFLGGLDPGERQMVRDLSSLRITGTGPPGEF